jgi:predicted RNA-binding protein with PUA-like domain
MAYWLVKSEPNTWSWDQHVDKGVDPWTGVRNYQARTFLNTMKPGDGVLFYHSGDEKAVVGTSEVVREAYPDPTDKDGKFVCVDLEAKAPLKRPVSLTEIKAQPDLADMVLVRNSRLSVQPVAAAEWARVREMGGLGA